MIEFFFSQYRDYAMLDILLEITAVIFGLWSVWGAMKDDVLVFPTGIISTLIYVYLLWKWSLLGDMMINGYYFIMSIYGWYKWSTISKKPQIAITRTTANEKKIGISLFFITMGITYLVYKFFHYSLEIPNYIDIFTSGIFFTGMWYMALKKIENWTLWIIGDIIAVPLFAYRGLGMLSLQYLIFTILAVLAYIEWKKILNNNLQK